MRLCTCVPLAVAFPARCSGQLPHHVHTLIALLLKTLKPVCLSGFARRVLSLPPLQEFFDELSRSENQRRVAFYFASWHSCWAHFKRLFIYKEQHSSPGNQSVVTPHECLPYPDPMMHCHANNTSTPSTDVLLHQKELCMSSCTNTTVVNSFDTFKVGMRTNPAWIFLINANTSCYKYNGEEVLYYRNKCFQEDIIESLTGGKR